MKVIFICKDTFPYSGACSSLLLKMIRAGLREQLDDIHVICSYDLKRRYKPQQFENGVTIHGIYWWDGLSLKELIDNIRYRPIASLKGIAIKLQKKVKIKSEFEFDNDVVRQIKGILREIDCNANDVIIPVAGFYETVKAALAWKRVANCSVITYQVDPCSTNASYSTSSLRKRQTFEANMYHQSDIIITTPIIKKELGSVLKQVDMDKTVAMEFPNLELSKLQSKCKMDEIETKKKDISCVFCGMVYKGVRNPKFAIELFSGLEEDIKFIMVGVTKKEAVEFIPEQYIGNNIIFCGYLSAEESQKYIEKADFLVNIGNQVLNQIPSKLFTYIETGKPIINLCTSRNCPTIPYLLRYSLSLNIFDDDLTLANKQAEDFIRYSVGKRVSSDDIEHNFKECSAEYCATVMSSQIKKLKNKCTKG